MRVSAYLQRHGANDADAAEGKQKKAHDRLVDRRKDDYYGIQKYRDITLIDRPNNMPINIEK